MTLPIIGVLGPARSGKDLVADFFMGQRFCKVSFADPMKRFARKVFDIPMEVLWGPSGERSKGRLMDETKWKVAEASLKHYGVVWVEELFPESSEVKVDAYERLQDWFRWFRDRSEEILSPRVLLQTLGTEWGRNIEPHLWVRYLYHQVIPALESGAIYSQEGGLSPNLTSLVPGKPAYRGIVIPDHRFPNEVKVTQLEGGFVIKLNRLSLKSDEDTAGGIEGHASETSQKGVSDEQVDLKLDLPEGESKVYAILGTLFHLAPWLKGRVARDFAEASLRSVGAHQGDGGTLVVVDPDRPERQSEWRQGLDLTALALALRLVVELSIQLPTAGMPDDVARDINSLCGAVRDVEIGLDLDSIRKDL